MAPSGEQALPSDAEVPGLTLPLMATFPLESPVLPGTHRIGLMPSHKRIPPPAVVLLSQETSLKSSGGSI